MENPIKMDDLGVPLFLETPIYICVVSCQEKVKSLFNRVMKRISTNLKLSIGFSWPFNYDLNQGLPCHHLFYNPKKLEKPWITKGFFTWQSLGFDSIM